MNRFLPMIAAAAITVAGGAFFMSQNQTSLPGISMAVAQDADVMPAKDIVLGNEDAPVTVIEYASYTCPHCANWHTDSFKKLKKDYIDTGKVKFIHREVYFDRFGLWAGMIAQCAGETRYYGMTDMIYSGQKDWIGEGDPATILDNLRKIGRTAGMTNEEMETCLTDESFAQSLVAAYQQNATADEIRATPTFMIGGEKYSNMSYEDFAATIEEKLAE
ncbi:DsbA family protein [Aliiroseovarius crassostreae]|uniref:DsbA family protein n=1 Tax=Aliiroseovarius crassostreae TaxID=154981 RepID=A0A9Q9HD77_9RHOB|nr:DsbA family protein [Aliiroseovarius crassostreae]UWP88889.1 DsbA family protein [Aliiroseovarius crassostreae]UWP92046.1 DsbA family protein [Aliiroseovarius crassostreae]UWP95195.1 DsbA family protein [Aliiroseovarius crassostreae]